MISAKQIRAARVFLEWEQRDLAEKSGLSLPTIQRMEKLGVERSSAGNALKVKHALEEGGVEFIPENGGGAGLRLRDRSPAVTVAEMARPHTEEAVAALRRAIESPEASEAEKKRARATLKRHGIE